MILGSAPLTIAHVVISLIGIASGFVVMWGLLTGRRLDGWTTVFLASTVATSVTGFIFFPFNGITPGIVLGVLSLVVLAIAIVARYPLRLAGRWRWVYAVTAVIAQYLNFVVLIVQSFQKIPTLHELAPTQSETPFTIVQLVALVLFLFAAVAAAIRFRPEPIAVKLT